MSVHNNNSTICTGGINFGAHLPLMLDVFNIIKKFISASLFQPACGVSNNCPLKKKECRTLVHLWHAAWWEPNTFVAHAALTWHCRWTRSDHPQLMLPVTTSTSTRWTTCRRCVTPSRCSPSCSACPASTRTTSSASR
jgi:hypothetical protein